MAFCVKCGKEIDEGVKFCTGCGAEQPSAAQGQAQQPGQQEDFSKKVESTFNNLNNTADTTAQYDQSDIEQNKVMAILAYIGILVLVPLFAAPNSKFARFHANQGLALFIAEVIYSVAYGILSAILAFIPVLGALIIAILGIASIAFLVLAVLGIVNASGGKAKELPFIGKYKILK